MNFRLAPSLVCSLEVFECFGGGGFGRVDISSFELHLCQQQ